nr:hypothetical protein [Tanacetum cinerariifolium]
ESRGGWLDSLITVYNFYMVLELLALDLNNNFTSSTIISVKLTGTENYRVWVAAMKLAINIRNRIGYTDRTYVKSVYANNLFLGQIFFDNAAEIWAGLKKTYDKLDGEDVLKHNQLIKLVKFLMGLNDVFRPISSGLLSRESLLDVKDTFSIVSREESHRGISSSSAGSSFKPQVSSFMAKSNNWNNNGNKKIDNNKKFGSSINPSNNRGPTPNLLCKNCGKVGHTID